MASLAHVDHDLHVHTYLSSCSSDEEALPEAMLARAASCGIRTVGFADHLWDAAVPGASSWYQPQDFPHISRIRQQLPDDTGGVRVLTGCETEYVGGGCVGIAPTTAEMLDFVLVPHSHFHMEDFVRPASVKTPGAIAQLLQDRYAEAIELEVVTGIAHPFLPCILPEQTDDILGLITDDAFSRLFERTARLGVSVEITTGAFASLGSGETDGHHDEAFMRVYRLALRAGCLFHFASDTHSLEGVGKVRGLEPFVTELGLKDTDILPLARGE
jgi:histidinol phosphatase-like PHP family hydrolase